MKRVFWALQAIFTLLLLGSMFFDIQTAKKPMVKAAVTSNYQFPVVTEVDPNALLELMNNERRSHGLPLLIADETLAKVARARAQDMQNRLYYAHTSPTGETFGTLLKKEIIPYTFACENLDLEFTDDETKFIRAWAGSQAHRDCLLAPDTSRIGLAAVKLTGVMSGTNEPTYLVVAIHTD